MRNMIVCPEPLAAEVGESIFARGGNAMDAAIAAAFAQSVSNPFRCGLGGTGILYYYDAAIGQSYIDLPPLFGPLSKLDSPAEVVLGPRSTLPVLEVCNQANCAV